MRWFTKAFTVKLLIAVAIFLFSFYSSWVEVYYCQKIYPYIGQTLRFITQFVPFSLGDVLYGVAFLYIILKLIRIIFILKQSSFNKIQKISFFAKKTISIIITIYIVFKLIWGLNYNRLGIAHQLQIDKQYYCKEDISNLLFNLIGKANYYRLQLDSIELEKTTVSDIYAQTKQAYIDLPNKYTFLQYKNHAVKSSIYSKWGKYFGFTGYYNPFSGEAQLRYDAPKTLLPVVACHEVAHQLGYANESEANFIGFLVAANSNSTLFNYSAYLDLILYAQSELIAKYLEDDDVMGLINTSRELKDCINPLVKKDIQAIRTFFQQEKTAVSQFSNSIYNQYLKLNSQKSGLKSYDEVVGLILAYYRIP